MVTNSMGNPPAVAHAVLGPLGQTVERHVARRDLVPRRGHTDLGLVPVVVGHADGPQHGPGRGPGGPVGHLVAADLHAVRARGDARPGDPGASGESAMARSVRSSASMGPKVRAGGRRPGSAVRRRARLRAAPGTRPRVSMVRILLGESQRTGQRPDVDHRRPERARRAPSRAEPGVEGVEPPISHTLRRARPRTTSVPPHASTRAPRPLRGPQGRQSGRVRRTGDPPKSPAPPGPPKPPSLPTPPKPPYSSRPVVRCGRRAPAPRSRTRHGR